MRLRSTLKENKIMPLEMLSIILASFALGFVVCEKVMQAKYEKKGGRFDDIITNNLEGHERIEIYKNLSCCIFVSDIDHEDYEKEIWINNLDQLCVALVGRMGRKLKKAIDESGIKGVEN